MAVRFRKSFKIAPGVRLNVGKKSASVTLGGKFFRQSFNTSGRNTTSASIPGTGISFYETSTKKKKQRKKAERKVRMEEAVNREPETVVNDVIDHPGDTLTPGEPEPHKPKLWLWAVMALVLVAGLWYILGNGESTPDVTSGNNGETVSATQFSYSAEDVELKMMNGALTAFVGGKQVPYTGLANAADGTYVVKNGVADTAYNGLYEGDGAQWLVKDGKVASSQTGIQNANGDWVYIESGVVQSQYTGVKKNEYGRWYVNGGHVDFGYNGVARSDGSTYLIKDGKVDTSQNGVMQVDGTWAYVRDGMINTNFTGVASNQYGDWYVKNGIVQLGYDGVITANGGQRYDVNDGKASVVTTTRASSDNYSGGSGTGSRTQNNNVGSGIVASSESDVYHNSWCNAAKQINGRNLIHFNSVEEAEASGRRACKKCF